MGSKLDLINLALGHLGQENLVSALDADPAPRSLKVALAHLPTITDAVLRKFAPLCATRYRTLSAVSPASPSWRYANAFVLQDQVLRVWLANIDCNAWEAGALEAYDGETGALTSTRKAILTDFAGPLDVATIERVDYPQMDAVTFDALGLALAARMAGPLTADVQIMSYLNKRAAEAVMEIPGPQTSESANQDPVFESRWIEARGGSSWSW